MRKYRESLVSFWHISADNWSLDCLTWPLWPLKSVFFHCCIKFELTFVFVVSFQLFRIFFLLLNFVSLLQFFCIVCYKAFASCTKKDLIYLKILGETALIKKSKNLAILMTTFMIYISCLSASYFTLFRFELLLNLCVLFFLKNCKYMILKRSSSIR